MLTYSTPDGERLTGATSMDIVLAMLRLSMFTEDKHPVDYMRAVSKRCAALDGRFIRSWSADDFVADLVRYGYLTPTLELGALH